MSAVTKSEWFRPTELSLNIDKSRVVLFRSHRKVAPGCCRPTFIHLVVRFNEKAISQV